jgi:hypothetical protein
MGDVVEAVAAEEDRHVVLLEERVLRVAREANGVEERRLFGPAVDGLQALPLRGDEPAEVREPPRDRHSEPGRSARIRGIERGQRVLERASGVSGVGLVDRDPRRHELVVQRRHEHVDPVVLLHRDPVEEVLLDPSR